VKRSVNIWTAIDKVSILLYLLLAIIGWLNIYAAVYNEEHKEILDFSQRYGKQFIWIIAAIIIAFVVVVIDIRFYFFFAWPIYALVMFLLVMVLIIGNVVYGARSWFEIGGLSLQPSELAKFSTALALAAYLNSKRQELTKIKVILPAVAVVMLPAVLIALQPDMGSAVVFTSFFFVMFREGMSPYIFVSGLLAIVLFLLALLMNSVSLSIVLIVIAIILFWLSSRKGKLVLSGAGILLLTGGLLYLLKYLVFKSLETDRLILIAVLVSGIVYAGYFLKRKAKSLLIIYLFLAGSLFFISSVDYAFNNLLQPHQKERVEIMLGKKTDLHGTGYNVNQSLISIGSGGFTGKGFLQGTQTKFKFVPKQSSDFIFCTVGEEWGFIGSFVVIGLYLTLLLRLVFLAERQRSAFSRIYGYGVASILFIHVFINIGMAVGLVPVIGIPLPFLSYGGSSLWGFTVLLFVFLRLDASRSEYLV
jgi:rod shape determining protein RodA